MKLSDSVGSVKGIGKIQAKRLNEIGLFSVRDLLWHFPTRYEDMRPLLDPRRLQPGALGTLVGKIEQVKERKTRNGQVLFEASVRVGDTNVQLAWFGNKYLKAALVEGLEYRFSGKVSDSFGAAMVGAAFELVMSPKVQTARMLPVYELTAGVTVKMMRRYLMNILRDIGELPETLPGEILRSAQNDMPGRSEAFRMVHDPASEEEIATAKKRFAFEEVYYLQLSGLLRKRERETSKAPAVPFQEQAVKDFVAAMPFQLTNAQRKASWRILQDLAEQRPMQRLLNGDVGAGKTAVAAIAAYNVAQAGLQSAILAPTDILARQHFQNFKRLFAPAKHIQVALLTQSAQAIACGGDEELVKKKDLESDLRENMVSCVIGTHALLEDWMKLPKLALAVVDEQHRFGVKQRETLKRKRADQLEPHFLSMTATPIPRSLALVFYGDVDVSVLDELPPGRMPITTKVLDRKQALRALGERLRQGERGYVVCPLIDPSDALGVKSVEEVLHELRGVFKGIAIEGLHGRMSAEEKDNVMQALKSGAIRCVVSTTVVEVGVDVPEATFICIEGAERFGLAELHQLRGRVGRGSAASFCYLVPTSPGEASTRLAILERETSGFRIAEFDLRIRGQGSLYGTAQSGDVPMFKLERFDDVVLLEAAKEAAAKTLDAGPLPPALREELSDLYSSLGA